MDGNQFFEFICAGWEYLAAQCIDFPLDCIAEMGSMQKLISLIKANVCT